MGIKGALQFHTPLSSTHQFHTKGPLVYSPTLLREENSGKYFESLTGFGSEF